LTLFWTEKEVATTSNAPDTETVSYTRRRKSRTDAVTDTGLRYRGGCRRLVQGSSSDMTLEYRHPVIKYPETRQVVTTPAPGGLFPGLFADVSVLAGMMISKFVDYLPLYRQHRGLARTGITVSRSSPVTLLNPSISLLAPIAEAQSKHILGSRVLRRREHRPSREGPP
jgi:transposase